MIEVVPTGGGWTWRMIGANGAVLVYTNETWPSEHEAFDAGRAYRAAFWAVARSVDHRMGACL